MTLLANISKNAAKGGLKGAMYGALAGGVLGMSFLLMASGVMKGSQHLALLQEEAAKDGLRGFLNAAAAVTVVGLESYGVGAASFAASFGWGALAGAAVGAIAGMVVGGVYGAFTDKSNPMRKTVDKVAERIVEKTPNLAEAVTLKVQHEHRFDSPAVATKPITPTSFAPESVVSTLPQPEVSHAPVLTQPQIQFSARVAPTSPTASYREKVVLQQNNLENAQSTPPR